MIIKILAAEHGSYWLKVEVSSPNSPSAAGYVRAVVVATDVSDEVREQAAALAAHFDVDVQDDQLARAESPKPRGFNFSNPADKRLEPDFRHGATEGRRLGR